MLAVLPIALTLWVYGSVVGNYFLGDDFLSLYQMQNERLAPFLLLPHGGHVYLARNLVFVLTHALAGLDPRPYYASALVVHLVNVYLLYRCLVLLTERRVLASFGAALWGVSPLHRSAIGWYSVFGHVMVGTALLVILHGALVLAHGGRTPERRRRILWYVTALVAATSFGTGTAIAMVLPFVLWLVLPRRRTIPLLSLVLVVPAIYVGAMILAAHLAPATGPARPSVLTMPLLVATAHVFVPFTTTLVAFGLGRLALGDALAAAAAVTAGEALLVVVALAAAWLCVRGPGDARRRLAAFALLLGADYGSVAVGRGFLALHATVFWSTQGRHHYVGQLVLTLLVCLLLAHLVRPPGRRAALALLGAWIVLWAAVHVRYGRVNDFNARARRDVEAVLGAIHAEVARHPPGETVIVPNRSFAQLPLPHAVFPGWAGVFVIYSPRDTVDGRRVRFLERDAEARRALATGRRTATLIVAPEDVVSKAAAG